MRSILFITLTFIFSANSYSLEFNHKYPLLEEVYNISTKYGSENKDFYKKYNFYELNKNKVLLNSFFNYIKFLKIEEYKQFSKEEKISFLVNLHNAFIMKSLLENMPIKRFQELNKLGNDFYSRKQIIFLGGTVSLLDVENKVKFLSSDNKPLFYLYKGSFSSPYINKPLIPSKFSSLLEENLNRFVEKNVRYYKSLKTIYVSILFKFYFFYKDKQDESFKSYISKIKGIPEKDIIKIKYFQYNWDVNAYWLD